MFTSVNNSRGLSSNPDNTTDLSHLAAAMASLYRDKST